ncbi:MAG: PaaI family thioesterase [Actinobacteria bacterium]|nr:PaaI family thioesterase [Actinomycetota bacterium]
MSTPDPANLPNPFKGFHIRTEERSPTDELRIQIAQELRVVVDELLATSAPVEELERTRVIIDQAVSLLKSRPHSHDYEGPAEGSLAPMNSFLDRSPIIGAINPLSVPMRMDIEGDGGSESTVVGHATFPAAYEGPPGCVHGGFIAAYFDEVLGMAQSLSGNPGMTVNLGRVVSIDGRKISVAGTLHHGETLCAEAKGLFVSMRPEVFSRLVEIRQAQQAK